MSVTVSVVIPVRNGASFLGEAIESVLAQTTVADQIIVVDDGSTDTSAEVARSYPHVTVLSLPATGPSGARNRGVQDATSEFVAFLDADDLMRPTRLASQSRAVGQDSELSGVFGAVIPFSHNDAGERIEQPVVTAPLLGTLFLRRQDFLDSGGFDEGIVAGELGEWLVRVRQSGLRFAVLSDIVGDRRRHEDNLTLDADRLRAGYLQMARAAIGHHRSNDAG